MSKKLCEKKKKRIKDEDPKFRCKECKELVQTKKQICKPAKIK